MDITVIIQILTVAAQLLDDQQALGGRPALFSPDCQRLFIS